MFCCCATEPNGQVEEAIIPMGEHKQAMETPMPEKQVDESVTDFMHERQGLEQEETKQATPRQEEEQAEQVAAPLTPEEASEPTAGRFEVDVTKGDAALGMRLDSWNHGIYVGDIKDGGVIRSYNDSAEASKKVQVSDYILAVNGTTGLDDMIKVLKTEKQIKLSMFRPTQFKIKISKGDKLLGLNVSIQNEDKGTSIFVGGVNDGAAMSYNTRAPQDMQVNAKDCIISVNGVSGNAKEMLATLKRDNDVELVLVRPPPA